MSRSQVPSPPFLFPLLFLFLLLFLSPGTPGALAEDLRSTGEDQTAVAVTIYNQNLALVKDRRLITLKPGTNQLDFRDVSGQMRPETALLRNVDRPDSFRVLEQNFNYDLLTPAKLLEKYTGREIKIARMNPATGEETVETAKVLSTNQGVVLRFADRIETQVQGRLVFEDVPDNLRDKPTLSILMDNSATGTQQVELSYLTGGLSWEADYVAELNDDDSQLDLLGWVTLDNRSGASYDEARLQLVAGDVNRVRDGRDMRMERRAMAMAAEQAAPDMAQESLFAYHLYTLGRPTTIADQQTKQVSLLTASSVPVTKKLILQGQQVYYHNRLPNQVRKSRPGVYIFFDNEEDSGLGTPLPRGVVRVYKRDSAGSAQFVGEDAIDHTAKKETVRLKLGESFDVTARGKQTDYRIVARLADNGRITESSYELLLKNATPEPVTVIVREPIPGQWEITKESAKHKKFAANMAEWRIEVPAEGQTTLSFTARVTL